MSFQVRDLRRIPARYRERALRVAAAFHGTVNAVPAMDPAEHGVLWFVPGHRFAAAVKNEAIVHNSNRRYDVFLSVSQSVRNVFNGSRPRNIGVERDEGRFTSGVQASEGRGISVSVKPSSVPLNNGTVQVVSSPVLETGVTVPHLGFVIDSGLRKVSSQHNTRGLRSLELILGDRSSLEQRRGQ